MMPDEIKKDAPEKDAEANRAAEKAKAQEERAKAGGFHADRDEPNANTTDAPHDEGFGKSRE
jgi:hypothetical protein